MTAVVTNGREAKIGHQVPEGTTLLDGVIPRGEFCDQISVDVKAPAEEILQAFAKVTPREMPVAAILGYLRYLPARLLGRSRPEAPQSQSFIEGIKEGGWVTLAEEPGRELVFGGAGKYHQIVDQAPVDLADRADFFTFDRPEYQKLAISVRVEPGRREGENRLVMEHRTQALSDTSGRKFARYWLVIKPMGGFVAKQLLSAVKRRAERA